MPPSDRPRGDVLLGYLHPHEVSGSFHKSLMQLIQWDLGNQRRLGQWASVKCATGGIPEGRNQLCETVLASDHIEWLFMVDADMGFEPMILDQLLAMADPVDRPMVGGLCFAFRELHDDGAGGYRCVPRPTILTYIEHEDGFRRFTGQSHYPVNSMIRADATGGACVIIHRSVLERCREAFGPTWFTRSHATDGSLMGEDISFFARTGALEIPLWIHTGIRTTHMKNLWVSETEFWLSFTAEPAEERVDVIVPVLHRPENVAPLVKSLRASTGLARCLFVVEPGDEVEIAEVVAAGADYIEHPGTFSEKVNEAYRRLGQDAPAPWLLLVGDDVTFRPGWLDHAQAVAKRYGAQVVGTNDLANPRVMRGEHATHPLIRRAYVDELGASWDGPGVVCHEGYRHCFVDDEIVTVAKSRGVFQAALGSQVEHHHPIAGKATDDPVYQKGQSTFTSDRATFQQRLKAYASRG